MIILKLLNRFIHELQTSGAYTLIAEFAMLSALIKYLSTHNSKRNSRRHAIYKQLLLKIEPEFQDLDNNRDNITNTHITAYKKYMINDISIKFNMSKPRAKSRIKHNKHLKHAIKQNAREYAYRSVLSEFELLADTLNHNHLLRYLVSKYHSKEMYMRIYDSHKKMFYNKYSKRKYQESITLYDKWK